MPRTPRFVLVARACAAVTILIGGIAMLGPFQGAEGALGLTDKEAHVLAFFAFTLIALVAAPKMRRSDLAVALLALGGASELAQVIVGREGSMTDFAADAAGVLMAWAPAQAQALRRRAGQDWIDRRSRNRDRRPAALPTQRRFASAVGADAAPSPAER